MKDETMTTKSYESFNEKIKVKWMRWSAKDLTVFYNKKDRRREKNKTKNTREKIKDCNSVKNLRILYYCKNELKSY